MTAAARDPGALERSTDLEDALRLLAADVPGDVYLLSGRGATGIADGVQLADDLVEALWRRLLGLKSAAEVRMADGRTVVAVPVVVTAERAGHARLVAITGDGVSRTDTARQLQRGADVVAGHLRGLRAVRRTRREMASELLRRTLSGDASPEELAAWARALRIEARGHVVCVVIQGAARADDLLDAADAIEDAADAQGIRSLVAVDEDEVVAFLFPEGLAERSGRAVAALERVLAPLLERFRATLGRSSVIAHGMLDVARAVHDARRVCELNRLRHPLLAAADAGPPVPLSASLLLESTAAVAALHSALLAPLETYDAQHGSDLVETLDVFLSTCGQWSASAAELGIHVNTLRYRLARIEKQTGRDLASMADRADFYVALRTRALGPDEGA